MLRQADANVQPQIGRIQRIALIAAAAGLLLSVIGAILGGVQQFFQSYLFGYVFWFGPAVGSLFFLLLQNLVGGRWGLMLKRFLEAGAMTLPLMAVLFIPIILGLSSIYEWARPEAVAADPILQHKAPYLNTGFFIARAAIYFALWCGLAYLLRSWSVAMDRSKDTSFARRMAYLSGPGVVFFVLAMTFAMTDWGMSLEPHWFSTMYGVIFLVGNGLTTLALSVVLLALFGATQPLASVINADRIHDIGKLLFAFTCLWAYTSVSQYLIIWTGNLPEETPWYLHRTLGGWQFVAIALMVGQFALPFFLLLRRPFKRNINTLVVIALFILAMRVVDIFWQIAPSFHTEQFSIHWMDVTAFVGLGGAFVAALMWNLQRQPLLPSTDVRLEEATRRPAHGHS